jgi:hypothetical protein
MKNYRKAVAALVFALVLSASAFAGEIHTDVTSSPPAPTAMVGEMHTGKAASTPKTDITTGIALDLLQSLLSLL